MISDGEGGGVPGITGNPASDGTRGKVSRDPVVKIMGAM